MLESGIKNSSKGKTGSQTARVDRASAGRSSRKRVEAKEESKIIRDFKVQFQNAKNPLQQCVAYLVPIQAILTALQEAGYEVFEGLETLRQLKFYLDRMVAAAAQPDHVCTGEGESFIYLHAVISRYANGLFRLLGLPRVSLDDRQRRYQLNLTAVLVRSEARSAADKNDCNFDSDTNEKKDFLKVVSEQLTVPEANSLWQVFLSKNAEPSAVAWDAFFKAYEAALLKDLTPNTASSGEMSSRSLNAPFVITPTEETILRKIITRTGIPYVTPRDFNEFLKAFGDGSLTRSSYYAAVKMWRMKGFLPYFTMADAEEYLIHEPEGSYVLALSAYTDAYFNLYVMTTELALWKVALGPDGHTFTARRDNESTRVTCSTMIEVLKKCNATTGFSFFGISESYLSNASQEEVVALLQNSCIGTYALYTDNTSDCTLRISYKKTVDAITHLYVDRVDDVCFQLKWNLYQTVENGHHLSFDKFASLDLLLTKHRSFLRYNFDFDGVPEVNVVSSLLDRDGPNLEFIAPEMLFKGNFFTHRDQLGAETTGGYPLGGGGELLCDRFHLKIIADKLFFCLADGCSWGEKSRAAAIKASQGFMEYVTDWRNLDETRTTTQYRELILRGFRHAHLKIIEGIPANEIFKCGRTTILGGALLPLDGNHKGQWGLVFASVGDCKLFVWNEERGAIDITYGNRLNARDAGDSCGRVGPYVDGGQPDLRNLKTYFWNMSPEDTFIAVSDGVYDNLDPECLGLAPSQTNLPEYNDWAEIPPERLIQIKSFQFCIAINALLSKCKEKTAASFAHTLVQNALAITHKSRSFCEAHPDQPEPKNYIEFPGKMDHVTAIAVSPGFSLQCDRKDSILQSATKKSNGKEISKKYSKSLDKDVKLVEKGGGTTKLSGSSNARDNAILSGLAARERERDGFSLTTDGLGAAAHVAAEVAKLKKLAKRQVPKTALWKPVKQKGSGKTGGGNENAAVCCLYCPKEEENLISLPNVAGWAVSTLPTEKTDYSEFFSLEATGVRALFGLATSCSYNRYSVQTAENSLIRFMTLCGNMAEKKDLLEISESLVDILEDTNNYITTSMKQTDVHFHGQQNAALLGGMLVKHADEVTVKNGGRQWSVLLLNVGNNKAFYWDVEKQELTDLSPDHHVTDAGCLGPFSVNSDDPNWSNVNLYNHTCLEGGVILLLSAGVLHNFDPLSLGTMERCEHYEETDRLSRQGVHTNLENLLKTVDKDKAGVNTFEYTRVIFDYLARVTRVRSEMHSSTGFAPKRRSTDVPGYLGHGTCLAFRVGMTGDKEAPPSTLAYTETLAHRAKKEVTHALFAKSQSSDDARAFLGHSAHRERESRELDRCSTSPLAPTSNTSATTTTTSANLLAQYQSNRFYIGSYAERRDSDSMSRHKFMPATSPRHTSAPSKHVTVNSTSTGKTERERKGLTHRSKTASGMSDHPRSSKEGLGSLTSPNSAERSGENATAEESTSRINPNAHKRMSKKSSNH